MIALWIFLVLATLAFWPAYHQNGSGLNIWASENTERMTRWGEIQPPMFALVNSLVCVFCGGMIVAAARWLAGRVVAKRRRCRGIVGVVTLVDGEMTSSHVRCDCDAASDTATPPANAPQTTPLSFSTIAGYLTMAASFSCLLVAPIAKSHPVWLVVAIILSSVSEILISSLGLAQVAKLTPRHLQPIYTSVWFVTSGVGGQIAGLLGGFALLTGFRILVALCLTGAAAAAMLRRRLDV